MKLTNKTIYIIDDDSKILSALRYLFEIVNLSVKTYKSANEFLDVYNHVGHQGCIIADVRMPVMSGLELLDYLHLKNNLLPIIMMTGYGDISMAVRAMKLGAVDFILKPFNDQCLLEIIQHCLKKCADNNTINNLNERVKNLTDRELQVIHLMVDGNLNKEIAYKLSISMSTVEVHRASIMRKMQAKNLAQLIKFFLKCSELKLS